MACGFRRLHHCMAGSSSHGSRSRKLQDDISAISIKCKLAWIYDFKAYPQGHTSSSKAITPRPSQTVSLTRDPVFYCLRLRRKILIQTSTVNKSSSMCLSSTPTFPYLDYPCCEFWCFELFPVHMWVSRCRKELKRYRNHKILLISVIPRET